MLRIALAAALFAACGATALAGEYELPKSGDLVGQVQHIKAHYEDTFVALARTYDVGYDELRSANPNVDPWLPGEGTDVIIPTQYVLPHAQRRGIVINVPELRLYYYPADAPNKVITHPISVGRQDWTTPLGETKVVSKVRNPAWYPPESIRKEHAAENDPLPAVVPPGPDNPLGLFALRLGIPGYLIHGTNKPAGVGMRVSHGCIRLFPEDVEALFKTVPVGTPVFIVDQPYKLGWGSDGALYLEAHPPFVEEREAGKWTATDLTREFVAVTEDRYIKVEWDKADAVMHEAQGIPVRVSKVPAQNEAETTAAIAAR
ncbi:MAG TPA: L,D-transpeptidase family protein [Gammaproteobacteria bacterium]|nr:L,D-transpeptidase family protein [Gammaproteobacteria bacterium]